MKRTVTIPMVIIFLMSCGGILWAEPAAQGVTVINNRDYGPAVLKLIRNAQKNIKVLLWQARFYEKYPDSLSNQFLKELSEAVKRGVNVTAIIDISDWHEENKKFNTDFGHRLAEAGAEVYFDSPDTTSHGKVMLVDDLGSVVSSANWSHYSLAKNNEVAVIVWSSEVNEAFNRYFQQLLARANKYERAKHQEMLKLLDGLSSYTVDSVEPLNNRHYFPTVHKAFGKAEERIYVAQLTAQYYMTPPWPEKSEPKPGEPISPTNVLLKDLIQAHKRGLDVKVILDIQEGWANKNEDFANRLLAENVPVYFDSPTTTTHAKMIVVDDDTTIVGSTNWTYNAIQLGNESSVLIKSKGVNQAYSGYFNDLLKNSTRYTPGTSPARK